jgi:hypothetical protein
MPTKLSEPAGEAVPSQLADLVDDLHRSGAISDIERTALISALQRDVARDIAADASRNPLINPRQPAVSAFKEAIMNPKVIINSIERSRSVMEAQVEKLNECAPTPPRVLLDAEQTQANVSTLLNTTVRGHLQGAADALHAIAEVETHLRLAAAHQTGAPNGRRQPQIIDAEAIVINPLEAKP